MSFNWPLLLLASTPPRLLTIMLVSLLGRARAHMCMYVLYCVSWHIMKGSFSEREDLEQRRVCPLDLLWVASQHSSLCLVAAHSDPVCFPHSVRVILWTACSMDSHMGYENSHLALSSPDLLWKPAKTGNCCQTRLWGSTYRRFGPGGRELCSQAVIQSDKAQRWNGRAEGNRSNGVLTNEES